ncbi:MAG: PAS domain-containing protein [Gemmatimonadetes bacterium]|nr:PAS domain-containing protein [Gemmatimonadota bacterium]MBT8405256.1 PAS domain-containing protein [Gemmatimonadota bacterium]NNK64649.1 PAS domain-containing protein [Gemmatimonadota bacterium]
MDPSDRARYLDPREILRWVYLGRLSLLTAIFLAALVGASEGGSDPAVQTAAAALFAAAAFSLGSFWWTERGGRPISRAFRYAQVIVDVVAVTVVVHLTGGPESEFSPVYILVIAEAALLLPLPGGVLAGILASALFAVDAVWVQDGVLTPALALQVGLFTLVAVAIGILGDRLRRTGLRLGVVESELEQLRLDTTVILDTLATGVLTLRDDGRVAYINPAAARLLGIEGDAWRGQAVVARLEAMAPGLGSALRRSIEEGEPVQRAKAQLERDGRRVTIGVSTTVMDRREEPPHSATALFQDITDQEALALLTRRADRLGAVAELSASLAHEIKNPLASIRSSVEQLSRGVSEAPDREVLERLVLSESDRLSRLLSEFLEFSGLTMGSPESVDLIALVDHAVELVRQHPAARSTEVRIEASLPDGRAAIQGDRDLLHRALFNLILNAAQFAGDAGRVEVELRRVSGREVPGPPDAASAWRLRIRDSGPGIDAEVAQRIFDPFYTTRSGGSGLGLAVVHRAVEAHDGAVLVGDAPSGGAEFTLFLPAEGRE